MMKVILYDSYIAYSRQNKFHQQGVAFIMRKELTSDILNYTAVSERTMNPINLTIIQMYAPTSDYEDKVIE